jgi:hypothetical protein
MPAPHLLAYTTAERGTPVRATHVLTFVNVSCICGSSLLVCMSLWPGYANGCFALLLLPLIGLLGLTWLLAAARALPKPFGAGSPIRTRSILAAPVIMFITFELLLSYVPRKIAFLAVRNQFSSYLAGAPVSNFQGKPFGRRIGIYAVDTWAADPRGGVYFRTGTGPDGIGPDLMSYGFAFQPNPQGSPYGRSRYTIRPLGAGWYWFTVSDDDY